MQRVLTAPLARPELASAVSASTMRAMRLPSEPLTSKTSPGRSASTTTGASAGTSVSWRAAPIGRQGVVQTRHVRSAGEDQVDAGRARPLRPTPHADGRVVAQLQHVAQHGEPPAGRAGPAPPAPRASRPDWRCSSRRSGRHRPPGTRDPTSLAATGGRAQIGERAGGARDVGPQRLDHGEHAQAVQRHMLAGTPRR